MKKKWIVYGFCSVAVASMLTACAVDPNANAKNANGSDQSAVIKPAIPLVVAPKPSMDEVINNAITQANVEYSANDPDKANALLMSTANTYPDDKRPWLRMTQAKFEQGDYSGAIDAAQQVLKRDPTDSVASSTLVVSGLRLSNKALENLRKQNKISGSLRTQAQELAKILHENLGQSGLVAKHHKHYKHDQPQIQAGSAAGAAVTTQPSPSAPNGGTGATNPFGSLK